MAEETATINAQTRPPSAHRRAVLQALLVTFLWSTSWVLIKIGLEEIPAATFAGLRYSLAFLCLLPFAWRSSGTRVLRQLTRQNWVRLSVLGLVFYTLTQGAQFVGLEFLPAVTVNLALSLTSVVVALFGVILLGEYPGRPGWIGIALSALGAWIFFYPAGVPGGWGIGVLALIVGVLANAGASLLGRAINRRGDLAPLTVTVVSMGIGGGLLLGLGLVTQGMPTLSLLNWTIIAWLAIVNTAFAFTLWNHSLRVLSASQSAILNNTMMIQIPILAVAFLGERLDLQEVVGMGLAVLGVVMVSWPKQR
jgi:drug/metabolite transporter (DMT)-like permease